MKIFYTASYYGKRKYQRYYDKVLKVLEETDAEIVSPEKGNYMEMLSSADRKTLLHEKGKKRLHYEAIRRGINWSDAVVIEISNEDFQLGHEATLAIQRKKPVLCLSVKEDFSEKIENRYFHGAKYNEINIRLIIQDFIKKVERKMLSERFNFFLSTSQLQFLENTAKKKGINKSEYLRGLIEKDRK